MNINAIIQARMGSTRLPGKILLELSGKPILAHVVDRLRYSKFINEVIIATTDLPEDNPTEEFCKNNDISFFRGSSNNVLSRYYEAAKKYSSDLVIRITADCPVIDPMIIDDMLGLYFESTKTGKVDYLSNVHPRTFPRGLDAEIFTFTALEKAYNEANKEYEQEHVTPFFYQNPEIFSLKNFANNKDYSFHRWTVDTDEDFKLVKEIYFELYQPGEIFLFQDILNLFDRKPELFTINQDVKQKSLGE